MSIDGILLAKAVVEVRELFVFEKQVLTEVNLNFNQYATSKITTLRECFS